MTASNETLTKVRTLLRQALALLDQADAPADIGAHLDFTLSRLEELIGDPSGDAGLEDYGSGEPH